MSLIAALSIIVGSAATAPVPASAARDAPVATTRASVRIMRPAIVSREPEGREGQDGGTAADGRQHRLDPRGTVWVEFP